MCWFCVVCFFTVNELAALSDDCRYLVLLAKIQNKVDKNEEALLSLQKVSGLQLLLFIEVNSDLAPLNM